MSTLKEWKSHVDKNAVDEAQLIADHVDQWLPDEEERDMVYIMVHRSIHRVAEPLILQLVDAAEIPK